MAKTWDLHELAGDWGFLIELVICLLLMPKSDNNRLEIKHAHFQINECVVRVNFSEDQIHVVDQTRSVFFQKCSSGRLSLTCGFFR